MNKNFIKLILVIVIILYGFLLRGYMYQYFPFSGEPDEAYSVWNGLSLINDGEPASWSGYNAYKKENVVFQRWVEGGTWDNGNHFAYRVVQPWFDHFPLFSLIVGMNAKLFNLVNFTFLPTGVFRLPMLLIGLTNLTLVYLVTKKLFNYKTALITLIIYATSPLIVFSSRMTSCENLLITFELLIIFFITKYLDSNKRKDLFFVYFFLFLAFSTKATAGFFGLAVFLTFLLNKKNRPAIYTIVPIYVAGWLIFLYGFIYDISLFLRVMKDNATRGVGFSTVALSIFNPTIVTGTFFDGWFYFGIISTFILFFKNQIKTDRNLTIILTFFLCWLTGLIFTSAEGDLMGWYRYPLFPLMAIASGKLLFDFIKDRNFLGLIFSSLFLLTGFYVAKIPISGELIKGIIIFTILSVIFSLYRKIKLNFLINIGYLLILAFMVIANSLAIINYYRKTCLNTKCNIPVKSNVGIKIPDWKTLYF